MDLSRWIPVALAVLALPAATPAQDKQPPAKAIDADTVAAYQKLGARYGGWRPGGPYYFFDTNLTNPEIRIRGFQFPAAPKDKLPEVTGPFGLRFDALTDEGLKDVVRHKNLVLLHLFTTDVTDAGLKELANLKDLRNLAPGRNTTDKGLKELAALKNLEALYLEHTRVTADGLKELAGLDKLISVVLPPQAITDRALAVAREAKLLHALTQFTTGPGGRPASAEDVMVANLKMTRVSDAAFKELTAFPNLRTLLLHDTPVTGKGFKDLVPLKMLHSLELKGTRVTDDALQDLAALAELEWLDLRDTAVTDAGLKHLPAIKKLSVVSLNGPNITNDSLKELANVKGLQAVYLYGGTKVTDEGVAELRKVLPKCQVTGR